MERCLWRWLMWLWIRRSRVTSQVQISSPCPSFTTSDFIDVVMATTGSSYVNAGIAHDWLSQYGLIHRQGLWFQVQDLDEDDWP